MVTADKKSVRQVADDALKASYQAADTNFAQNMAQAREDAGISQAELVQKLRDRGWKNVHPTTISRIEKGERPVKLSEAGRIAGALDQPLVRMMGTPERASAETALDKAIHYVVDDYNAVIMMAYRLIVARRFLCQTLNTYRKAVEREGDPEMAQKLQESERFLALRIDTAVQAARNAYSDDSVLSYKDAYIYHGAIADVPPEGDLQGEIDEPEA